MLSDNVSLITGGASGIGLAIAQKLHSLGTSVAITDFNGEMLKKACESMKHGLDVLAIEADVRNPASAVGVCDKVLSRFGQIDILVNSAGVSQRENVFLENYIYDDFKRIMDTNVDGLLHMTCAVMKTMRQRDSGYIINILSTAAYRTGSGGGMYAASKSAARALTETLTDECRGSGIRVSSISPGPVATNIWSHKAVPVSEERKNRMLSPRDIADIAAFLVCTDKNVHIDNVTAAPWKSMD